MERSLERLKLGGFLTEFGAVSNDDDSIHLLEKQAEGADKMFQSWAYWTYKNYDDITTQNSQTETFFNTDGYITSLSYRFCRLS